MGRDQNGRFAKGNKFPEEWKKNLSKLKTGVKLSDTHRKNVSLGLRGIKRSESTRKKISECLKRGKGDKSRNWKGGITPIRKRLYFSLQYKNWREQIFIRDNFTCQYCGQYGGYLEVHHKKTVKNLIAEVRQNLPLMDLFEACLIYTPFWDIENGKTLCKECHGTKRRQ